MAADEEQIVLCLECPQRVDWRLGVERASVADDQPRPADDRRGARLRGGQELSGARRSHQRSGSSQGDRERLTTVDESIAHGPQG